MPDVGHALGPESLAQNFNNGMQAGAPMSAGAESLSQAISQNAMHTEVPHPPEFSTPTGTLSAAVAPTSGGLFAVEGAHAGTAMESATAIPPAAATSPTMFAAPMAPAAPMAATPPPMAPVGPLPAYGADLRPATPTITASPAPTASSPTSAPVNPSSGAGGITQPAVVNKAAAAPTSASAPTGLTESALAATASGAAAGAISAQSASKNRLRHLVEAVARQQPHLRWAIGERDDGSTVLVTDVASGWVPPNVEIPTGVHLLTPAQRRGGLEALLGDAAIIETWTPGQYLPPDKDTDPVPISLRARDLPAVDDLNWEITQATNWRDGLPRLAHTLTKAGIAGTGVLDAETDLLQEHLRAISDTVFKAYPESVDAATIGNWQLLAAIDALVTGQKTALNYHFAWFQALHMASRGTA